MKHSLLSLTVALAAVLGFGATACGTDLGLRYR